MKFEAKATKTPGPEVELSLRIAEMSLPMLLEGQPAEEVKLVKNVDGTYGLTGTTTIGTTRESGVKPAIDVLVDALNEFADVLDQHDADIPQPVAEAWDAIAERWTAYRGERRTARDS